MRFFDRQKQPESPFIIPPSSKLQKLDDSQMQAEARRCLGLLGEKPTPKQWEMILAATSSTCVIAGAGSGKSTTLILRILVMHKLLGISLDEMHVFSFTRASTEEFQQKLANKLMQWEERIEQKILTDQRKAELQKQAKRVVSTFHSVMKRLSGDVLPGGSVSPEFFDFLGSRSTDEEGNYNPFVTANLSDEQKALLSTVHALAYQHSSLYRTVITSLIMEQEEKLWQKARGATNADDTLEQWKWTQLLKQEQEYHGFDVTGKSYAPAQRYQDQQRFQYIDPYRAAVADRLLELGIPFIRLAPFPIRCPIPRSRPDHLMASFQVGEKLFLHIERYSSSSSKKGTDGGLLYHERDRRSFIALYSEYNERHKILQPEDFDTSGERPVLTVNGEFKLDRWLDLNGYALNVAGAPPLRLKLPGDLHRTHIAELLYQEGTFIESLGLEVEQLRLQGKLDPVSLGIAQALAPFWRDFQNELNRRDMLRFHDILTRLRNEEVLTQISEKLKHLHHLFIDEFQDISPEIVDWLAKTMCVHVRSGVEVSITAIGDDYQSIYGWRGSHPVFLMRFERYFPSAPVGQVVLTDNFRSRQPIIDAAEAVLETVRHKVSKHGESSFRDMEAGRLDPVRLIEAPLSWNAAGTGLWPTFCSYVALLLQDLAYAGQFSRLLKDEHILRVFILARSNSTRVGIPNRRDLEQTLLRRLQSQGVKQFQQVRVRAGTFHTSKGLEADVVLLLDDVKPSEEHPLRELVFSQATMLGTDAGTYTQAMLDEARRLAYVALTRARLGIMWVPLIAGSREAESDARAANGNGQADTSVSAQGSFVLVRNYLQTRGRM